VGGMPSPGRIGEGEASYQAKRQRGSSNYRWM
jgi:hypothetical protein